MVHARSSRFWLAFAFLNSLLVLSLPGQARWWTYALPSLDVVALVVGFVLLAAWGKRLPRPLLACLVPFFLGSGLLRAADGVEQGAYLRDFSPGLDLPLLPELVRLLHATLPRPLFGVACALVIALVVAVGYLVLLALGALHAALGSRSLVHALCLFFFALAFLAALGVPLPVLQPSMVPRWAAELQGALELPRYRARERARIATAGRALDARPRDVRGLRGQDVYVFLIESYGQCVLDRPELFARVEPEYRRWERELSGAGFQIASRVLDSPVYGGRSWLAQATLLSGVPVRDQLQFELLRQAQLRTIPQVFETAGYRSVLAQPGTVRPATERDLLHFTQRYVASDLGYRGPRFGWATMPDQYVLDAIRRRELSGSRAGPLFLGYALVSSHIPWSDLPPVVQDWSAIADGSLFRQLPTRHYDTTWLSFASPGASAAYADAIAYDLEVVRRYLTEFVTSGALVIVLGDHQPHSEITRQAHSRGVPVHVLSRNGAFVAPFRARGYTPGMVAVEALPHPGLDSLLPDLVADFSLGPARSAR